MPAKPTISALSASAGPGRRSGPVNSIPGALTFMLSLRVDPFVRELEGLDGRLALVPRQRRPAPLGGPGVGELPGHHRRALLVEQLDGDRRLAVRVANAVD